MNPAETGGPANIVIDRPGEVRAARESVVFLNSLATTGQMWDGVVRHLPESFSSIRFDQRDRGNHGERAFDLDDLVEDLLTVLGEAGVVRANVVGVSLGGLVALRAAYLHPERVRSVVAMCCAARFSRDTWLERGRTVRQSGVEPLTGAVMNRWFTFEFQEQHPDALAQYRGMFETTDATGYALACDLLAEADVRGDLPAIAAQTLVISGDQDTANPVADQAFIAAAVPGARHEVLLGTAHLAPVARPAEVARLIADHVGRVPA
jgi:3-oxoadipate enol-lactonase